MIPQEKAEVLRKFFRRSYFRIRNVTRKISEDAQDLVWVQSIRPKDAIHVATALDGHVSALETFDENLLRKTGTVGNPPLLIRKPMPPAQRGLFDG
jgi:predicted nucleic acid-binding protein